MRQQRFCEMSRAESAAHAKRERDAVHNSSLWQAVRPLRNLAGKMPPDWRRGFRIAARHVWWSITLQLPGKLSERREFATLFDGEWYLKTYADVAQSGVDPLSHYMSVGATEGRDPGPNFSTRVYNAINPDVAKSGINPLLHYVKFGRTEGRKISLPESADHYAIWIRDREALTEDKLAGLRRRGAELPLRPKISILMPTYNTSPELLRQTIKSVIAQTYDNWELCIADDGSTAQRVPKALRSYKRMDPRIKVVFRANNGGISLATNSAFTLATGEWITMLDHDDVLAPHALFHVASMINTRPEAQLIYSDEDKIDTTGQRYQPYFKPEFSLELFRSQNYLNHLTVHRKANIEAVDGWRHGFEGSQDYDLNLRIVERIHPSAICHIPEVLYHWRAVQGSTALAGSEKGYAYAAGFRALQEHVERLQLAAKVEEIPGVPFYRLRFAPPSPTPLVSLIIPTRDRADLLRMSIGSILKLTSYEPFEILIVDNGSVETETSQFLADATKDSRVRVLSYPHPFNYSAINNFAMREARGEILALVNNDVEVISSDWLDEMVAWAAQPEIGCVGAKLYYPNERIQHAGVILGIGGVAGHSHKHQPRDHLGYYGRLKLVQTFSAVTAACLVVRKRVYCEVGGLDKALAVAFNDVDFCLKVREMGYRNVWTPFAELYHHESLSRGHETIPENRTRFLTEISLMKARWGRLLSEDPFYSPHLTKDREDFSIGP